ncbi:MAG: response regulator [Kiritimatiellia bacterium]
MEHWGKPNEEFSGRKALAVDDQASSLDLLKSIFLSQLPEMELHCCTSGEEGLRLAEALKPDIIILDIKMPGMNGLEVCSRLRDDPELRHIPVLAISGVYVTADDRANALNTGANAYLCKPFKAAELAANVKALLRMQGTTENRSFQGINEALQQVLEGVSSLTGNIFFYTLTGHLARALNLDAVLLAETNPDRPESFSLVSVYPADVFSGRRLCLADFYPGKDGREIEPLMLLDNAADIFPPGNPVRRWNARALIVLPLRSTRGNLLGILAIMHRDTIQDMGLIPILLQVFATRAASEIEREQATNKLWQSEERYRSLTDDVMGSSSIGTLIVDANNRVAWSNKAFFRLLNLPVGDLTGHPKREILETLLKKIDAPEVFEEAVAQSYRSGMPLEPVEIHLPDEDKSRERWIRHWNQVIGSGLYMGGRIEHYADITAQMRAEQGRRHLEMAIEQAAEIFLITDTQGIVQYANPAFETVTGYSRSEILGRTLSALKSYEHDDGFYQKIWAMLAEGIVWSGHITHRKKDGRDYKAEMVISPVRDSGGRIINYVAVSRDVTHEMELEAQFRQAQKMESIGRLAGGVAHDFNNLLTSIIGFAKLVQDELPAGSPAVEDVQEIISAGDRAAALTKKLLAISRKETMQLQAMDLNQVIRGIQNLLQRTLGEDIEITLNLSGMPTVIMADSGMLEQVIMNLAVNSRDAMPRGGKIILSTRPVHLDHSFIGTGGHVQGGDFILFSIKDTGTGISPEIQKFMFEPFFTTKPKGKGTGLGLATVYGIVRQLKGHIDIESRVGEGAEIRIYFPASAKDSAARAAAGETAPARGGTETILLVEDEDPVRVLSGRILRSLGYHVLDAANAEKALQIGRSFGDKIHLVLSDIVMPGMNGPQMIEELRKIRTDFKTMYCSGFADDRTLEYGLKNQSAVILAKPFTAPQLAACVRQILDNL